MNEEKEVLPSSSILVLCSTRMVNDAVQTKNVETFVSSFFVFRHSSKVIARVTQKSLTAFLDYFRAYLALRGSDNASAKFVYHRIYRSLQNSLPMVANLEVTLQSFCSAPGGCIAVGLSCAWRHRELHNLKCKRYGRK